MSSFAYDDRHFSLNQEITNSQKQIIRSKIRFFLLLLIFLFSVIIVGNLVWNFLLSPKIQLRTVQIVSEKNLPVDVKQIKAIIGLDVGSSYPAIDCNHIENLLKNHLVVESVKVEKHFPDRLVIYMKNREPIAMGLFVTSEGRTVPVQFDKEGVVLHTGSSIKNFDLPIISGDYTFPVPVSGEKIQGKARNLLGELYSIREENEELFKLISEVKMNHLGSDHYEMVFYVRGHRLPLLMKENFSSTHLLRAIEVMDALKDVDLDKGMTMLDYRSGLITFSRLTGENQDE